MRTKPLQTLRALALLGLLCAIPARADEPAPAADAEPAPEAPTPAAEAAPPPAAEPPDADDPGCAEEGGGRKGVQKRDFLKKSRLEISAHGGFFAGDLVSTSYTYGGSLAFYFTEDFGVETTFLVTPIDLGVERPLTQFFQGQRFHASDAYTLVGDLVWSPIHLKVRATEKAIVHGDLLFYLGAGDTFHDSVQGVTFDAGLGLKIYPTKFLAIRFDVRDYILVQEVVSVQRTTNNIVGTVGLSFWVLPWF
jgi:outer membrane beta-barrel protein